MLAQRSSATSDTFLLFELSDHRYADPLQPVSRYKEGQKRAKKGQKKGETRPEIDQWEENTIIQNRISFSIILTDAG
jgi:hypothetical protein